MQWTLPRHRASILLIAPNRGEWGDALGWFIAASVAATTERCSVLTTFAPSSVLREAAPRVREIAVHEHDANVWSVMEEHDVFIIGAEAYAELYSTWRHAVHRAEPSIIVVSTKIPHGLLRSMFGTVICAPWMQTDAAIRSELHIPWWTPGLLVATFQAVKAAESALVLVDMSIDGEHSIPWQCGWHTWRYPRGSPAFDFHPLLPQGRLVLQLRAACLSRRAVVSGTPLTAAWICSRAPMWAVKRILQHLFR